MTGIPKELVLTLYRWATGLKRSKLCGEFARLQNFPACVLFYHRVSDHLMNEWSISSQNFSKQLHWITQHSAPVSLDEVFETQAIGKRTKPMVAVTFDDGYGENTSFAIPQLLEMGIPVTYFVATHFVESGDPFPHDVTAGKPLRPNTVADIKRFAKQGVQIGAHSHTHVDFGRALSQQQLRTEIRDVRKRLQDWTNQAIDYFAFPYGLSKNITQEAIDMVFESGYKCFLSAAGGYNWPNQQMGHLQRIHGDPGIAALKNWLTFDPRKLNCSSPISMMNKTHELRTEGRELANAIG